jgi:hypothetical protein
MFPKWFHRVFIALVALGLTILTSTPALASIGEVYGPYLLIDVVSGKCINNPNSSQSNNTVMIIYTCTGTASNERWDNETAVTTSDFWTFNVASGKCLTVQNASMSDNAAIIQYSCTNGANERWVYDKVTCTGGCIINNPLIINGVQYRFIAFYKIENLNSGRCITVKNASRDSGATLLQYNCDTSGSNTWMQYAKV